MPAKGGRPKKPTALKLLHGDFEKNPNRRNKNEPSVEPGTPDCPKHLPVLARNEWRRVTSELKELRVLSQVDRSSLEQYVMCYAKWRDCITTLKKEGDFYETEKGVVEHPAGKALRQYAGLCHRFLCEFGMTPSSRSRVQLSEPDSSNDLEKRYLG
jgi:P27 family predicted phage terminase small subunit